jgi:hypothetical protein
MLGLGSREEVEWRGIQDSECIHRRTSSSKTQHDRRRWVAQQKEKNSWPRNSVGCFLNNIRICHTAWCSCPCVLNKTDNRTAPFQVIRFLMIQVEVEKNALSMAVCQDIGRYLFASGIVVACRRSSPSIGIETGDYRNAN